MGEANKRGTYEQRLEMAKQRNSLLVTTIQGGKNRQMKKALHVAGPQRLAVTLQMAGMLYAK